jgi:hypothetical protein
MPTATGKDRVVTSGSPHFGWMTGAVGAESALDVALYREMIADVARVVEHHFPDDYPTPGPLLLLSHIVAR